MAAGRFLFLLLTLASGCGIWPQSRDNTGEQTIRMGDFTVSAEIFETENNFEKKGEPVATVGREKKEELMLLIEALGRAEKIPGIVDVAPPRYLITFHFAEQTTAHYFLWLGEESVSIMDETDSHTLYRLPAEGKERLTEWLP